MSNDTQQIVNKAWNFAHVLRDDGLSYMAYTEQITFLLFLKMADEQTRPPYNRPPIVPARLGREILLKREGDLRRRFVKGWQLVPNPALLCIMNLYLHGIDGVDAASRRVEDTRRDAASTCPVKSGVDSLASDPGERFSVVLTNPPFGKKS